MTHAAEQRDGRRKCHLRRRSVQSPLVRIRRRLVGGRSLQRKKKRGRDHASQIATTCSHSLLRVPFPAVAAQQRGRSLLFALHRLSCTMSSARIKGGIAQELESSLDLNTVLRARRLHETCHKGASFSTIDGKRGGEYFTKDPVADFFFRKESLEWQP